MDTLPLPPRPNLAQYRKRAKGLVAAARSGEPDEVRAWADGWMQSLGTLVPYPASGFARRSFDRAIARVEQRVLTGDRDRPLTLGVAQFLIAEAHGFPDWGAFADHVERLSARDSANDPFEAAADAVAEGELPTLEALLAAHPELIRARSARVHRATLLHYVAANGVEDFRQKTPANAVAVARLLLASGAEADALAETYGGGHLQTTMNLLVSSAHPAKAGLQSALVEALVDFGAATDGLGGDGSPLMTALEFGHVDAAETLARRGARVDNVLAAAGLGRLDLLRSMIVDARAVQPEVPLIAPPWLGVTPDAKAHIALALVWACKCARPDAAGYLLGLGVDAAAKDSAGLTALHWAATSGSIEIVDALIDRGAPLEARNMWGGTVLGSTLYFALHDPKPEADYPLVVERLLDAGADPRAVAYPTGEARLDALLGTYLQRGP